MVVACAELGGLLSLSPHWLFSLAVGAPAATSRSSQ